MDLRDEDEVVNVVEGETEEENRSIAAVEELWTDSCGEGYVMSVVETVVRVYLFLFFLSFEEALTLLSEIQISDLHLVPSQLDVYKRQVANSTPQNNMKYTNTTKQQHTQ